MTRHFVLVPPSEGKAEGGQRTPSTPPTWLRLERARDELRRTLGQLDRTDETVFAKLSGARGPLAVRATLAMRAYVAGRAPLLAAYCRYEGVVWQYLDARALGATRRARLLVPSGLYGLTDANEPVADYRLKMSVRVGTRGLLHDYWRPEITAALARRCRGATLWNLLPGEHARAVDFAALAGVTVRHVRFRDVGGAAVGHDAKAVKGALAHWLLTEEPATIAKFSWGPWRARVRDDTIDIVRSRT